MELTQLKAGYYAQLLDRNGNGKGYLIGIGQHPALAAALAIKALIEGAHD